MKLRFESDLPHQRAAIDAVVDAVPETLEPGGLALEEGDVLAYANPTGFPPRLAVEMETGTGKTYTFVRTALALAARHGVRKVVVVVPSVAIREGVVATLQATRGHFASLFPELGVRFFAYRRDRLSRLRQFVRSSGVEFVVLTADAFTRDTNVLCRPCDAFGGHAPLHALAATRPLLITDEQHRFETQLRRGALAQLQPCLSLGYGATLGADPGLVVHRLTPAQAHREGLVKSIVVRGARAVGESGYAGQIRDTIAAHMRRQEALRSRGIKVLSLFFLDRVAAYTAEDGLARQLFDQHFDALKAAFPGFADRAASSVRAGYFATRTGKAVDSKTGRSAADADAYELILRDKARLLSFDEPVSFVFSHSALREGWDNPNVFQICTLGCSDSAVRKRQEIGRGVRLCVNQDGRRARERSLNTLEVCANESYEDFVAGLQRDEHRPEAQRAPVPSRRAAEPGRPPAIVAAWPPEDRVLERAAAFLQGFEPTPAASRRNVLDHALALLARRGLPLRRATVLSLLEASGCGDALASDPVRGGDALARALTRALES